jgi:chromosome segregation ATPase
VRAANDSWPRSEHRWAYTSDMSRSLIERRLTDVAEQLKALRTELAVADEQLHALADAADEARLRSLVSETPLADHELREAQRHADAMERHRSELCRSIDQLETTQDELLDRLFG